MSGFRLPLSPASSNMTGEKDKENGRKKGEKEKGGWHGRRDSTGVRKLLSLSSLRNSFASSRTSLSLGSFGKDNQSTEQQPHHHSTPSDPYSHHNNYTTSTASTPTTHSQPASQSSNPGAGAGATRPWSQGTKRNASALDLSADASTSNDLNDADASDQPPLRKKKSTGWFNRRRSSIFALGENVSQFFSPPTEHETSDPTTTTSDRTDSDTRSISGRLGFGRKQSTSGLSTLNRTDTDTRSLSGRLGFGRKQSTTTLGFGDAMEGVEHQQHQQHQQQQQQQQRPSTATSTSSYSHLPPPTLPDVNRLRGGELTGGRLGAEELFAGIGR